MAQAYHLRGTRTLVYRRSVVGLTFIAGQLLPQSPEEDTFWIFVSLMDSHLRPVLLFQCRPPLRRRVVVRQGYGNDRSLDRKKTVCV